MSLDVDVGHGTVRPGQVDGLAIANAIAYCVKSMLRGDGIVVSGAERS
jgi:hypothetical protein